MIETNSQHLSNFTRLPVIEMTLADKPSRALRVMTPHKGEVVIEYHQQGMFREKTKDMGVLLRQLRDLEFEAHEYLLSQWLKDYYRPLDE